MDCRGKTALITGSARRVGRAIAFELARAGCDVAVHFHRSGDEAERVAAEIRRLGRRSIVIQADLREPDAPPALVRQVADELGGLDVLVNNAAIFPKDDADQAQPGQAGTVWQQVFRVNVFAPVALIDSAASWLRRSGAGKVVNLCDISADRPWPGYSSYCASKAALVNLTKSYARKLAPEVQVNGVSPGIAQFPEDYSAELRERLIAKVPLKRPGSPEDIARAVRFLVEHGDYITGQIINVDGGRSIV